MKNKMLIHRKLILLTVVLLVMSVPFFAEMIGRPKGVLKPYMMRVSHNTVYISDQNFISFFDSRTLQLKKKVGGKGVGPGEFHTDPLIKPLENKLLVYLHFNFYFYSKDGEFLKQLKYNGSIYAADFVEKNFIVSVTKYADEDVKYHSLNFDLLDSKLKTIKTLSSRKRLPPKPNVRVKRFLIEPVRKFQGFNGKIYIAGSDEESFGIKVFDHQGTFLNKIQLDYERIKIPDSYKKKKLDEFKQLPPVKRMWKHMIKLFDYTFPDYFPAAEDFRVKDGKIYIKTFKQGKSGVQYRVLDLQGKLLGNYYLPDVGPKLYDISKNHFYYLIENEDLEDWELHSIKIQ